MTAARLVVDASVIVTVLLDRSPEADSASARLLGAQLHAPDHLAIEVVSALRRMVMRGEIGETEAHLALRVLWKMAIQLWRLEYLAERTWQLRHSVSSYDAAYVALAERLDATLLTADARLARASGLECVIEIVA